MKTTALITNEIMINLKQIVISFVLLVIIGFYLVFKGETSLLQVYSSIAPLMMFSLIIGKSCLIEEKKYVYRFLKTLPVKTSKFILSKYLLSILVLSISSFYVFLINMYICNNISMPLNTYFFTQVINLIFASIFLLLFYKYNYYTTQFTGFFMLVVLISISLFQNHINLFIDSNISSLYILLIISFIILYISFIRSTHAFNRKE